MKEQLNKSEKSLSSLIPAYKKVLSDGDVHRVYQSLVNIVQNLRTGFSKKYKKEYSAANVLHGYIDFTYFYLQNDYLKKHKLKFSVVLNHQKACIELWLLGQTKDVQARYWERLKDTEWADEKEMPEYSIFEVTLLADPDFDDVEGLSDSVYAEFDSLSLEILNTLKKYEAGLYQE